MIDSMCRACYTSLAMFWKSRAAWSAIVVVIFPVAAWLVFLSGSPIPSTDQTVLTNAETTQDIVANENQPELRVLARDLSEAYASDSATADATYGNKYVAVSATVHSKIKDFSGAPILTLKGHSDHYFVSCQLTGPTRPQDEREGRRILVRGFIRFNGLRVVIRECRIIPRPL